MAKGQSTFRQLGKIDGRKYYQVKGVDGIVSQSINQGMSNRVKNDAAYANTRLNNAEFGSAGSTAGAITRALLQKWRYLLVPFATGKIAKDVRALMMQDSTGKWGQRGLTGTNWQRVLAGAISNYSKNPFEDYSNFAITSTINNSNGLTISASSNKLQNEKLEALGCNGVTIIVLGGVVNTSAFDATANAYAPAIADMRVLSTSAGQFGGEISVSSTRSDIKSSTQKDNTMYGGVVIVLPYKTVNGTDYIMQEHCSFKMIAAEPAA